MKSTFVRCLNMSKNVPHPQQPNPFVFTKNTKVKNVKIGIWELNWIVCELALASIWSYYGTANGSTDSIWIEILNEVATSGSHPQPQPKTSQDNKTACNATWMTLDCHVNSMHIPPKGEVRRHILCGYVAIATRLWDIVASSRIVIIKCMQCMQC